jgi:ABC-type lipoprotein export system ATPase subunit
MQTLLKFENICKSYGSQVILDRVSLEIKQGETIAIAGPSGTGKTTLLNLAGTLDIPDSGKILFNNQQISDLSETERSIFRNRHIGFVFQMHYLLPQCTVLGNVLIPTLTYTDKAARKAAAQRATDLLETVGMLQHKDKLPSQLSGGECQRTAFARALINQPELLLADEPTGSLDEENAEMLSNELLKLNNEFGTSLIVVTHSTKLAEKMGRKLTLKQHIIV